jgi:O-antigen/teichoic acid export membrane protein
LGTKEYNGADYCLMPIIVGGYFAYLYTIPVQIQYYYEKTKLIGIMSVLAALLNICLNAVFIPYFGYIAAAYTTAVTYIIYFGFHSLVSYKISKESYFEYKMLLLCGIVCVAVAAVVIILIPFTMIRWIIAIVIALIAIICFWRRNTYFKRISSGDGCK